MCIVIENLIFSCVESRGSMSEEGSRMFLFRCIYGRANACCRTAICPGKGIIQPATLGIGGWQSLVVEYARNEGGWRNLLSVVRPVHGGLISLRTLVQRHRIIRRWITDGCPDNRKVKAEMTCNWNSTRTSLVYICVLPLPSSIPSKKPDSGIAFNLPRRTDLSKIN